MYGKRRDNVMKAQRKAEMIWNGTLAQGKQGEIVMEL
jgi:hypothetical protein